MSVSKYAYSPKKCDGEPCPGDCDFCSLADESVLSDDIEDLMDKDWFKGTPKQREKICFVADEPLFSIDDVIMALWMCSDTTYETIANELHDKGW